MKVWRLFWLLILAAPLGACGFHPLYASGRGHLSGRLAAIYVDPVPESTGYELRNTMIDLLGSDGRSAGKAYRLKMTLDEIAQDVAQQSDASITRYNDTLTVKYVLTDANGTVLTQGEKTSLSAYNVVKSPYATLVSQQDADKRAAQDIAARIRIDLSIYFDRLGAK
jgi:LPS-assembly lipoprotein